MVINFTDKTTGMGVGQGDATITASPCTFTEPTAGAPTPAASEATVATPSTCKGGSVGQVNGVQICIPYDPNKNTIESTTKSTATNTASGPSGAASSTTSSSTTTKCDGANCTTEKTTTKNPGDGSTPTTEKETAVTPKDDFCQKNPADQQCKSKPGSFGGQCGSAPVCDGDAVMCAIAAATFSTNCALNPPADDSDADYKAAKLLTGSQISGLPGNDSVSIGQSNFDTSDAIGGGGSCIADKTVTVAGKTFSLPLSSVCPHLALLGNVLLLVSFLLAGRIVVRG